MNHLSDFVTHYGYWAVVVGCLLEGKSVDRKSTRLNSSHII